MSKPLPEDIKSALIRTEELRILKRISGFYVPDREIAEAAYHNAREIWEANGYYEPPCEYIRTSDLKKREQQFLDAILPPIKNKEV